MNNNIKLIKYNFTYPVYEVQSKFWGGKKEEKKIKPV